MSGGGGGGGSLWKILYGAGLVVTGTAYGIEHAQGALTLLTTGMTAAGIEFASSASISGGTPTLL